MRRWLLLLAACSGNANTTDASTIDVAACAGRAAPELSGVCVPGGLAGLDLAGTWTITGTLQRNAMPTQPYAGMLALQLDGAGWCDLGTARSKGPYNDFIYINSDQIYHYDHSCNGFPCETSGTTTWFVCTRASDGLLFFSSRFDGYEMDLPATIVYSGTLTR